MVTFKEIEIAGFKSFADETHIKFDGGITAIVGPNGCGKSNISDAIRWVLGERSNKALRGKSSQDVIFAGTEKRKKLSYCEVSLVFDNTNRIFNIDYDEVVLTRKLYRSGESDYMINRNACKQRDIIDLMYDSGIGKDGYSIIGQGRVEEIIQSKPEDRRAIFEEAAGIAKFKARKTETENRLATVRDNLSRATDIITEVERRLGPLKKQSEDAKKYLEYREELKTAEINAYIYQYDHAAQTKQEINTKLAGYKDNLNILIKAIETEQAKYDKSMNEINNIDNKANSLHDQILHASLELEKHQGDNRLLNEQTKHLKEQIDRLQAEIDSYALDISQKQALVDSATQLMQAETENLQRYHKEAQEVSDRYFSLVDELNKSEDEKQQNQREIIDSLAKLTDIKANLSAYVAKRDTLQENINQDKQKLEEALKQKAEIDKELATIQTQVQSLFKTKTNKEENLTKINTKMTSLEVSIADLNNKIFALKTEISNDINRKNILTNLQADFEGYQFAVKRLLQESKKNAKLQTAIKGVVGNIISVDSKYQTAIEIALGGSIQNIVTKDESDAQTLIDYLKQTNIGRATFLPITAVKQRSLSPADKQYFSMSGCLGIASELVKTDAQFKPIINSLLGATVVCDNLNNATNIAKRSGYAFRIVTLEGDVITPQGSMSGGSKKSNDSSLLGKETEIKTLEEKIKTKQTQLNKLEDTFKTYLEAQTKLKDLLAQETNALQNANLEHTAKTARLDILKQSLSTAEEEIFSYKSQLKVAQNIVDDLNKKINSIDKAELDYNSSKAKVGEYTEEDNNAYEQMKQRRNEYTEEIANSRGKIASTEEKIKALNKDIENYKQQIADVEQLKNKTQKELDSQLIVYKETINLNTSKQEKGKIEQLQQTLKELNEKLSQLSQFKQSLMDELKVIDEKKAKLQEDKSHLDNKIYKEENNLQKVDTDIETMQERVYEEYEMTYNDCLPFKSQEPLDIRETMIKINKLKNQISNLGFVNVNAIEEYKSEGSRYEEMKTQIDDLRKAEEDAVKIIADLSKEMLERFNTEFTKIQTNFTKVFKELFGGGNARLELLPSEDPLTAGVEIIAQPPGKILQQITLLSGGEKTMTAIAILFAILKLKPIPFCFLDEIEAALDDANIDRYAHYLQRFSNETQFIVITHRKPTMELADSLYGVTMEEKGVSKIVSVKLSEAVKVAKEDDLGDDETHA